MPQSPSRVFEIVVLAILSGGAVGVLHAQRSPAGAAAPPDARDTGRGQANAPAAGSPSAPYDSVAQNQAIRQLGHQYFDDPKYSKCLEFPTAEDQTNFRDEAAQDRTTFNEKLALKTEKGNEEALGQVDIYLMLVAEYSNPGCMGGGPWQPPPTWPKGPLGTVHLQMNVATEREFVPWTFVGATGEGHWQTGEVADLTLVILSPDAKNFLIHRVDKSGPTTGLTADYVGVRSHNIVLGPYSSTWPGHWKDSTSTWYAIFDMSADDSTKAQGPDRAQTEAAIDRKFAEWAQGWSIDQYVVGSARITDVKCSADGCRASGRFSFVRMGQSHTIPFSAGIETAAQGTYNLGRLCYADTTTGMQDCVD